MSQMLGVKRLLEIKWMVQLPREEGTQLQSPRFNFLNEEWYLTLEKDRHQICLNLRCELQRPPSFCFSVTSRIEPGSTQLVSTGQCMSETVEYKAKALTQCIWSRTAGSIQRMIRNFGEERRLRFRVELDENWKSPADETSGTASLTVEKVFSGNENPDPFLEMESLAEDLAKLLDVSSNPDVELLCEGHTTRAHKNILCTRSPVLASMFQTDMVEGRTGVANIQGMTNDTLQQFLRYLYTAKLDALTFDAAMRLYEAGNMYAVKRLPNRCSGFIIKGLTVENACEALTMADAHRDAEFVEAVIGFMLAKKVPMSGDGWRDFCESHPKLANKVYGRFCEMLCRENSSKKVVNCKF